MRTTTKMDAGHAKDKKPERKIRKRTRNKKKETKNDMKIQVKSKKEQKRPKSKEKKLIKKNLANKRGVIYLGHVPHGFYEAQMRDYFSQFGTVLRLRLSRSNTTGKSRGYAFIEFEDEEVAKIAVEAMNNYLMMQRLLKCEYIPPSRVHKDTFKRYGRRVVPFRNQLIAKRLHNSVKDKNKEIRQRQATVGRLEKLKRKLSSMGIKFDPSLVLQDKEKKIAEQVELEVDSSDDEVTLKTPPNAIKVRLRSKRKV